MGMFDLLLHTVMLCVAPVEGDMVLSKHQLAGIDI